MTTRLPTLSPRWPDTTTLVSRCWAVLMGIGSTESSVSAIAAQSFSRLAMMSSSRGSRTSTVSQSAVEDEIDLPVADLE